MEKKETCPHCGCQVYNPFGWGKKIYDVKRCQGKINNGDV